MCCDSWGHKESDMSERLNLLYSDRQADKISNLKFFIYSHSCRNVGKSTEISENFISFSAE